MNYFCWKTKMALSFISTYLCPAIQIFADAFINDNNSQMSILLVLISVIQQIQTFKYHLTFFNMFKIIDIEILFNNFEHDAIQ